MLVYGMDECFVMQMLYVCVLCASCGSSQCCILHDLQFVHAGRGCKRRPYGRGILCHKQIKKQQTSIRCNHTHNTHGVHLNCTQIKRPQYKPDWRCTIHTTTQIGTTTQSTDTTTTHRRQITQPLTDNNHLKDKNIVILQININGIRNKIEELKT